MIDFKSALLARNRSRAVQTAVVEGCDPDLRPSISAARHDVHMEIYPGKQPKSVKTRVLAQIATDILTKQLLVYALKQRFRKLNPDGTDLIDWASFVPAGMTFSEGVEVMERNYPCYRWSE